MQTAMPSSVMPRQETLLSCPARTPEERIVSSKSNTTLSALTCSLSSQSVPHVTVEVVVAGQQKPAGLAERYTGDAADDVVVTVHGQLLITSYVEHSAGGVITARSKSETIGEKLGILS